MTYNRPHVQPAPLIARSRMAWVLNDVEAQVGEQETTPPPDEDTATQVVVAAVAVAAAAAVAGAVYVWRSGSGLTRCWARRRHRRQRLRRNLNHVGR